MGYIIVETSQRRRFLQTCANANSAVSFLRCFLPFGRGTISPRKAGKLAGPSCRYKPRKPVEASGSHRGGLLVLDISYKNWWLAKYLRRRKSLVGEALQGIARNERNITIPRQNLTSPLIDLRLHDHRNDKQEDKTAEHQAWGECRPGSLLTLASLCSTGQADDDDDAGIPASTTPELIPLSHRGKILHCSDELLVPAAEVLDAYILVIYTGMSSRFSAWTPL